MPRRIWTGWTLGVIGSLAVAGSAAGIGEPFSAGESINCAGFALDAGCRSEAKSQYRFAGSCVVNGQALPMEGSGAWDRTTGKLVETVQVVGGGSLSTVATCGDDPWATGVVCAVSAHTNTTGHSVLSPYSKPELCPFTRALVGAVRAATLPACSAPPPPPPPPLPRTRLETSKLRAVLSGPKIVSPSEGETIPYSNNGRVQLLVEGPGSTPPDSYQLEFQLYAPRLGWVNRSVPGYATMAASDKAVRIPALTFPARGSWRVRAKAVGATSPWSGYRAFVLR